ncbi:kinetochore protein NDC80 homolog isoform X2 [Stigmatopora nigra]
MDRGRMSRTTGRLSHLPLRVQDPSRMSTAFTTPRSENFSMGKFSIGKPLLQTSEKRTSVFGQRVPRNSGASMPRNSSVYGFGAPEKLKDTRPVHDKAYVQQCIRQLYEFLSEKSYNVALKTLQSPSTKEFVKIFEFIYRQLDPTFEMPNSKVEEEVPALLKSLGYPFVLSKSSMYSVGAPHTWPQALGALMWLIDTVKIFSGLNQQDLLFRDFCEDSDNVDDSADYNRLFLDYTARTYEKYMQGMDTYEEDDEAFASELKKICNYDEEALAVMEEKHRLLMDEVDRLEKENQKDRLESKRMEIMRMESDLQKLHDYHANVEAYQTNQEKKCLELVDELNHAVSRLESLKVEQCELQKVRQNQKYTPADIERINQEKRELQQGVTTHGKSLEQAQQHKWSEEITVAKFKEKVELKLNEYHKFARKLKLIPASAENACGHDFELRPFEYGPGNIQLEPQMQTLLRKLIRDVEDGRSKLSSTNFSLKESVEQVNLNILDKEIDLQDLNEQIRKLDERWDANQKEIARDEQEWAKEVEMAESECNLLEEKGNCGYDEAMQQNMSLQQQYHRVVLESNEERRMVANNLTSVFTKAADHLSAMEDLTKNWESDMQLMYTKMMEDNEKFALEMLELKSKFGGT